MHMTTRFRISFLLYILLIIFAFGGGLVYLLVPTVMPYHLQAIGMPWEGLPDGVRALLWVLVKIIGGMSIIFASVMAALVLFSFRRGERWAVFTIPALGFLTNGIMLLATIYVRSKTGASTPVAMMAVSTGVVVAAFLLSLDFSRGR